MKRFKLFTTILFAYGTLPLLTGCSNNCTVTFDTNGGSRVESLVVKKGSKIYAPSSTKKGYDLLSWECENVAWNFENDVVKKDITLEANWDLTTYSITYQFNGGYLSEGKNNPTTYTIKTSTFTLSNPIKDGYQISNWKNAETQEVVSQIEKGTTGDIVLSASYYGTVTYSITYNLNGGSLPSNTTLINTYNVETETFSLPIPSKDGYNSAAWKISGTDKVITSINKGTTGNLVLDAYYMDPITFNLTVHPEPGCGYIYVNETKADDNGQTFKFAVGDSVTIRATEFEYEDEDDQVQFKYWSEGPNYTRFADNMEYTFEMPAKDLELYVTYHVGRHW